MDNKDNNQKHHTLSFFFSSYVVIQVLVIEGNVYQSTDCKDTHGVTKQNRRVRSISLSHCSTCSVRSSSFICVDFCCKG